MSTNYYVHLEKRSGGTPCARCGHPPGAPERLHIGKSSAGWVFLLRVYPGRLDSWAAWDRLLGSLGPEDYIEDEYGRQVGHGFLRALVTMRGTEEPRGLRRPSDDRRSDVRRGHGTWDLLSCEFD